MTSPFSDFLYPVHQLLEDAAQRHLPYLEGPVLDLGCGLSPYKQFLPEGTSYVGTDRLVRGIAKVRAAAERLPFRDASFRGAMCTEMLELSFAPWQVISELSRVLQPGGRLYVTVPFDWHLHYEPHDYFRITQYGMRSLLEGAGFEVEAIETVGGLFTSFTGKVIENIVCDIWLPLTQRLGIKRGAYRAAALAALPLNLSIRALGPLLDRASPRNPFCIVGRAMKK